MSKFTLKPGYIGSRIANNVQSHTRTHLQLFMDGNSPNLHFWKHLEEVENENSPNTKSGERSNPQAGTCTMPTEQPRHPLIILWNIYSQLKSQFRTHILVLNTFFTPCEVQQEILEQPTNKQKVFSIIINLTNIHPTSPGQRPRGAWSLFQAAQSTRLGTAWTGAI